MLRVALAQINPTVGDLQNNKSKILRYIERAKAYDCDLLAFPELAICGYPPEDLLYKEHFVRDNIKQIKSIVKETEDIIVILGFVDIDKNKNLYNAAAIIYNKKILNIYRKEELPNYGVFDEKRYFQQGKNNKICDIGGVLVGINICEDIWEKNAIYEQQAKLGANVIINISSSPYDIYKHQERSKLIKSRAKETRANVCYVNLVGGQDELVFDGGSFMVNPKGDVVVQGKSFEEDLVMADLKVRSSKKSLDRNIVKIKNFYSKPYKKALAIKRPKQVSQLERIYKALVLGTHDYVTKNGFEKILIGLSGGIDSSLVAAIAVDAIGKDNVIGVTMPSRYSSKGTRIDAKRLADNLGIKMMELPVEKIVRSYDSTLKGAFSGQKTDLTEENIQARVRGNLLMALSNKFGWLVLTTGNKSEVAVGYCTLYGDMSGGFAVIKDVLKTQVYDLAVLRNSLDKDVIPKSVIKRAPTAELRANQKDQDSLPAYDVLDEMLKGYVEEHHSLKQICKGKGKSHAKKIINLVDRNEYKRRQAPPGVKITPRAFGKDWRLPITNKYKEF